MTASTTSDNITNWKNLSYIDYFSQFIKSYLAFNAWMRTRYSHLRKDRKIIDTIKEENNEFRRRILNLLSSNDAEGETFKAYVSSLHNHLERFEVKNNNKKISFYDVFIKENPIKQASSTRNTLNYKVEISNKVEVSVHDSRGNQKYYLEQNKYNFQEILEDEDYQKLSLNQQTEVKNLYFECNPRKNENIVSSTATGKKMGQYYFVDDNELICKAIIEILYSLRCTLFHGEVLPDKDTNKVYEQAYHILIMLIQVL
ncbi:hypothetical protein ACKA06_10625 [Rossellomorea oryzaecorticis]|uniref:Apea-like HEPN domain-containing protein n=1 Tax=Rossellomorea oryzaecorticis TaxID=1396505 RepID=A0ABW8VPG3_9BACI